MACPDTNRVTAYNGYATTPKSDEGVICARLLSSACWRDAKKLIGKFAPQLLETFKKKLKHFIKAQNNFIRWNFLPAFFMKNTERHSQQI